MSALQKLAVAKEAGTSRSASAIPPSHNSKRAINQPGCHEAQQMVPGLHPLLQSLNFLQPTCGAVRNSVTKGLNSSNQSACAQLKQHNKLACRIAGSTPAATALAYALEHNHGTPLGSTSAHQLLQSIAATQKEQQLKQLATVCTDTATVARAGNASIISITAPGADTQVMSCKQPGNSSSKGEPSLRQALAAAVAASAAASAALAVTAKQPVAPLLTKPHKPGGIICMQPQRSIHEAITTAAAAAAAAPGFVQSSCNSFNSCKPGTAGNSGYVAAASAERADIHHNCVQASNAAAAAAVRPGTAAAFKILRSLSHHSSCVSRPRTASKPVWHCSPPELGQQRLQSHTHETLLSQQQQIGNCHVQNSQAPLLPLLQQQQQQQQQPECSTRSGNESSAEQQHWQQQRQKGEEPHCLRRPSTAALRAMLASSHSKDGIAERLEHYRKLNSTHDNSEGLDIVHEAVEEQHELPDDLPDWLKPATTDASVCQTAPMVLNLEDIVESTREVLEAEIEQQLQELDLKQLHALQETLLDKGALLY